MPSANESEFQIQTRNGRIFCHARQKWLAETPRPNAGAAPPAPRSKR